MVPTLAEGSRHPGTSEEIPPALMPARNWTLALGVSICLTPMQKKNIRSATRPRAQNQVRGSRGLRASKPNLWLWGLLGCSYQAWEMWPPFLCGSTRSYGPWGESGKEVSSDSKLPEKESVSENTQVSSESHLHLLSFGLWAFITFCGNKASNTL